MIAGNSMFTSAELLRMSADKKQKNGGVSHPGVKSAEAVKAEASARINSLPPGTLDMGAQPIASKGE